MDHDGAQRGTGRIGLIGGLAFRAGVFYYEQIARRYESEGLPLDLVLGHADVGTVLRLVSDGERAGLGEYLGAIANRLFDAGAELVAVSAVAPHLAIGEISRVARGPVVNVLDVVSAALEASGLERVGILGNRAVMASGVFGAVPDDRVVRLEPAVLDEVHAVYGDIALHGKRGSRAEVEFLDRVACGLINRGAQAILLAGTDLSSFYAEQAPAYPFVDVARLHIDRIVRLALEP